VSCFTKPSVAGNQPDPVHRIFKERREESVTEAHSRIEESDYNDDIR